MIRSHCSKNGRAEEVDTYYFGMLIGATKGGTRQLPTQINLLTVITIKVATDWMEICFAVPRLT